MAIIHEIKPTVPVKPTRKRVAAYARVSADNEKTFNSLSAQVSYYNDLIQSNPQWEFSGIYADFGISGTRTSNRNEFNRLIADCEKKLIDLILCKSISRLARNTVDLLETVRYLKSIDIEVRFEKEGINTLSADGEVLLTLLASFAQEESESISNNIKWGIKKRFEKGIPNGRLRTFGYRWEGEELLIVPNEAEVVKGIYTSFFGGQIQKRNL